MKPSFLVRTLNVGVLVLLGVGLASGQEEATPARAVLAHGEVRYVAPESKRAPRPGAGKPALIASSAAALGEYARYFGITDAAAELRQFRATSLGGGGDVLRYRQLHEGYPVIGGELVLSLDAAGETNSLSGEIARNLKLRALQPVVTAGQARQTALAAMAKYHPDLAQDLVASTPELWVYDPRLIGPEIGDARLVWRMDVSARGAASRLRELVLVNAGDGAVALHFNQVETALDQATYTANGAATLPGTLLCDETQLACTGGANVDADLAHRHARDTYNFYLDRHGRDSFDNLGGLLIASVNYFKTNECPNAFWNGTQMVYCAGAPAADDVVAHELTHAVTDRTSDLFYYYQSGAINESLSDVWGEFVDLTNGSGNDSPAVRWLGGEDFAGLGAIRNMANPPQFDHPDRMGSPLYWSAAGDNGGVHINSGVNNKAVTLMVDGGTFNGFTVAGIGINKVAALYYRVQTQHLTSGSDYGDLYVALNQACRNLIGGADGITSSDCLQVANALDAVEMNQLPALDAGSEVPLCAVNQVPVDTFFESAEDASAATRWSNVLVTGSAGVWSRVLLATHGVASFYTPGFNGASNHALTKTQAVVVPPNAFLHFRHMFEQEQNNGNWDGGIVEYSINGGGTWLDASALHSGGKNYTGLLTASTNPAAGSPAFVGASHGFVSTRYNLATLAGQSLLIRFRNTSDSSVNTGLAWAIDEIRIYTCAADASPNQAPVAAAGADQTVPPTTAVVLNGATSADPDGFITAAQWAQISGTVVQTTQSGRMLTFDAPGTPVQEQLVFRLTVTDNRGFVTTDDVTVTVVNQQPVANAGADLSRKPRDVVLLQASAADADGTIAGYAWTQLSGPSAGLNKAFDTVLQGATPEVIWLSTTPMAPGAAMLRLNVAPNIFTNMGGTVALRNGSEFSICLQVSGAVCTARHSHALTGSLSAPVAPDTSQPRVWTFQSVVAGGAPVTGSFQFNATTATVSSIQVTSPPPAGPVLSFAAPSVPGTAMMNFRVTSTDNYGGTGTDDIAVSLTNNAPTANAGVDVSVKAGAKVDLTGSGTDADGTIVGYSWVQTSGPVVTLPPGNTAAVRIKVPSAKEASVLVFQLTTTDNDGATAVDQVTVNVAAKTGGGGALDLWMLLALFGLLAGRVAVLRRGG